MKPTAEQAAARELFRTGDDLAIEAGAGTGKTSTLVILAGAAGDRHGQYVAFNKAIVTDFAAKAPRGVGASTAHGLAFRAVGRNYAHRLKAPRMPSAELARRLQVPSYELDILGTRKRLAPGYLAGVVMRGLGRFCQTADPAPAEHHFPYLEGIDLPDPVTGARGWFNNREVRTLLLPALRRAWRDWQDPRGQLPYRHEAYLKTWEQSQPRIPADYVLFDEAQDASPVMVSIVRQQQHAQVVWVGDSQQAIYEFTGAVNALATVPAEHRTFLTQSFRFGPAIADVANAVMEKLNAELRLVGWPEQPSRIGQLDTPHAVLCRTNAGAMTRFLTAQQDGRSPHLVGGGTEVLSFARAAVNLRKLGWTSHPELACFSSWGQIQEYVASDPQGGELKLMVNLVDEFGAARIITSLDQMPPEDGADVVVSTAHKSKGREWSTVKLADDFPTEEERNLEAGDWRLLYVAATRARGVLDVSECDALGGSGGGAPEAGSVGLAAGEGAALALF